MTTGSARSRRSFLKKLAAVPAAAVHRSVTHPAADFDVIKKIDVHTHISTDAAYLREVMDELNLKMFTINNEGLKVDRLEAQLQTAVRISAEHPRYYAWATTFGFERMYDADWHDRVTSYLKDGFDRGALAVKVWKEIGMEVRDPDGRLVQIDDPLFDPILEYVTREDKTLFAHVGDPVQRWLSYGPDWEYDGWYREGGGVNNRVGPFRGDVSYDAMIRSRDRMLSKHPELRVVGCHMGSIEFDVGEVARRLDAFPNFAVETSSAIQHLMRQSRERVRAFFIRYQDRVLYGADVSGGLVPTRYLIDMSRIHDRWTPAEIAREKEALLRRYRSDFAYYATDARIDRGDHAVHGLALPEAVLRKLFHANAARWVPGIAQDFE